MDFFESYGERLTPKRDKAKYDPKTAQAWDAVKAVGKYLGIPALNVLDLPSYLTRSIMTEITGTRGEGVSFLSGLKGFKPWDPKLLPSVDELEGRDKTTLKGFGKELLYSPFGASLAVKGVKTIPDAIRGGAKLFGPEARKKLGKGLFRKGEVDPEDPKLLDDAKLKLLGVKDAVPRGKSVKIISRAKKYKVRPYFYKKGGGDILPDRRGIDDRYRDKIIKLLDKKENKELETWSGKLYRAYKDHYEGLSGVSQLERANKHEVIADTMVEYGKKNNVSPLSLLRGMFYYDRYGKYLGDDAYNVTKGLYDEVLKAGDEVSAIGSSKQALVRFGTQDVRKGAVRVDALNLKASEMAPVYKLDRVHSAKIDKLRKKKTALEKSDPIKEGKKVTDFKPEIRKIKEIDALDKKIAKENDLYNRKKAKLVKDIEVKALGASLARNYPGQIDKYLKSGGFDAMQDMDSVARGEMASEVALEGGYFGDIIRKLDKQRQVEFPMKAKKARGIREAFSRDVVGNIETSMLLKPKLKKSVTQNFLNSPELSKALFNKDYARQLEGVGYLSKGVLDKVKSGIMGSPDEFLPFNEANYDIYRQTIKRAWKENNRSLKKSLEEGGLEGFQDALNKIRKDYGLIHLEKQAGKGGKVFQEIVKDTKGHWDMIFEGNQFADNFVKKALENRGIKPEQITKEFIEENALKFAESDVKNVAMKASQATQGLIVNIRKKLDKAYKDAPGDITINEIDTIKRGIVKPLVGRIEELVKFAQDSGVTPQHLKGLGFSDVDVSFGMQEELAKLIGKSIDPRQLGSQTAIQAVFPQKMFFALALSQYSNYWKLVALTQMSKAGGDISSKMLLGIAENKPNLARGIFSTLRHAFEDKEKLGQERQEQPKAKPIQRPQVEDDEFLEYL